MHQKKFQALKVSADCDVSLYLQGEMHMNYSCEIDASWDRAVEVIQGSLAPNSGLSRLTRQSWASPISNKDFAAAFGLTGIPTAVVVRAAQHFDPSIDNLDRALSQMGARLATIVASVYFSTQEILQGSQGDKSPEAALRYLINHVEAGYHVGMNSEALGPELGMMIGFSLAIGPAILVSRAARGVENPRAFLDVSTLRHPFLSVFGCEPHQVSSLALQRLGYGSDLASAAAIAFARCPIATTDRDSEVALWRAGSDCISAFLRGQRTATRAGSLASFSELLPPAEEQECSTHLTMLYEQIDEIREKGSTWSWHLSTSYTNERPDVVDSRKESNVSAV
jgi:hypothetical protein